MVMPGTPEPPDAMATDVARPPDGDAGNVRAPGRDGYGPEEVERVERAGRAARHTPGRTQPQAPEPAGVREERLLRNHPGARDLGVENVSEERAERRVLVAPHRAGDEQPVAHGDLLLDVSTQGHERGRRVANRGHDDAPEPARAGDHFASRGLHLLEHVLE